MPSKIYSASIIGLNSNLIEVEADISSSNPNFLIVGLPDAAVSEAKERVRSAIKNSDLIFPRTKVTVNLAPADLKKFGPSFDLPIAIAILSAMKKYNFKNLDDCLFLGELSLNGSLRPINGVLGIASALKNWGIYKLFLPFENALEATIIDGITIYPVKNLAQIADHFKNKKLIRPMEEKINFNNLNTVENLSFSEIKGQHQAKRALIITAAGYHNLLLIGSPGSGKTLLSRSLAELLPPLTLHESLEVTKIYSLAGLLQKNNPLIVKRPFRSPHHTSSGVALIGGGSYPRPGEITLAHRGILFLDEFPEFPKSILENLRQPLEEGFVTVSRALTSVRFPARFTLVAAANPCPCGYLGDQIKECVCSPQASCRYRQKISGPILDRIDLKVEVPRLTQEELTSRTSPENYCDVKQKIITSQQRQNERLAKFNLMYNSEMDFRQVEKICLLNKSAEALLKNAINKFQLTARSYHKVLKVARTIADLENEDNISEAHLAESLQFRNINYN